MRPAEDTSWLETRHLGPSEVCKRPHVTSSARRREGGEKKAEHGAGQRDLVASLPAPTWVRPIRKATRPEPPSGQVGCLDGRTRPGCPVRSSRLYFLTHRNRTPGNLGGLGTTGGGAGERQGRLRLLVCSLCLLAKGSNSNTRGSASVVGTVLRSTCSDSLRAPGLLWRRAWPRYVYEVKHVYRYITACALLPCRALVRGHLWTRAFDWWPRRPLLGEWHGSGVDGFTYCPSLHGYWAESTSASSAI